MATTTFTSDFLRRIRQREAVTGRKLTSAEIRGLLEAELSAEKATAIQSRAVSLREQALKQSQEQFEKSLTQRQTEFGVSSGLARERLSLLEDAIDAESRAAQFTGIKELAVAGAEFGPKLLTGAQKLLGTGGGTTLTGAGTSGTAAGIGLAGGEQLAGGATTIGALGGEQLAGGATTLAGETSLLSGVGGVGGALAVGGAGAIGGFLGGKLGQTSLFQEISPFGGEKTEAAVGGALGGALAGTAVLPGIGTIIGGIVGAVTGGKGGGK
jgi:hypothetical protein